MGIWARCEDITSILVTPDGSAAVFGGKQGSVGLWNLASSKSAWTMPQPNTIIDALALTHDASLALLATTRVFKGGSAFSSVEVWDFQRGVLLRRLTSSSNKHIGRLALSEDDSLVAAAYQDGTLALWDLSSGKLLTTVNDNHGNITALAFSPGGKGLACAYLDTTIQLWTISEDALTSFFSWNAGIVTSIAVDSGLNSMAIASEDGTVKKLQMRTTRRELQTEKHSGAVKRIRIMAEGKLALTWGADSVIRVWDLDSAICIERIRGLHGAVEKVVVTEDGEQIIVESPRGRLKVFHLISGRLYSLPVQHDIQAWAVTRNGNTLVCAGTWKASVWNLQSLGFMRQLKPKVHYHDTMRALETLQGTERIVARFRHWDSNFVTIRVIDLWGGSVLRVLDERQWCDLQIKVMPSGNSVIGWDECGCLVWELAGGGPPSSFRWNIPKVSDIAVFSEAEQVAMVSSNGLIVSVDLATGEETHRIQCESPMTVCVARPNRPELVVGDQAGRVYLLRLEGLNIKSPMSALPQEESSIAKAKRLKAVISGKRSV